ncbi:Endothiapepsin [Cladobotryum mycophilum]|uniref:Endothiapepsin n=1 Tax=Cladobotryum mycophilum TaxID=491253 RepID=A0ABR0SXA5_9HYPO
MQTFGAFIVSIIAASGMVAAVPTEANTASVKAVYNTQHVPHGPAALLKAYKKYNVHATDKLTAAAAKQPLAKRQTGSAPTSPDPQGYDREYLTQVSIGTPAQTIPLDFDTGSSDLWVFAPETSKSQSSGHKLYDPSKSTSAKKLGTSTWSIRYGDGSSSSGDVYTDSVTIGGFTVKSQAVETAKTVSAQFAQDADSSGLLGLAFDAINTVKPTKQKTWFSNAKSTLKSSLFTANLKHQQDGTYNFGYIDSSEYTGPLTYVPVDSSEGFWGFTASGYSVGSGRLSRTSISGIADTGTSLLLLPDNVVDSYYNSVQSAQFDDQQGGYTFDCSASLPSFNFGVGSSTITVSGDLLNYAPIDDSGETCFGGIQSNGGDISIFGDVALKAAVVVFDGGNSRLGWAQK